MQTISPVQGFSGDRDRGLELMKQRKYKDASRVFLKEVARNKQDPEAWYYLGLALIKQEKELKAASKAFETAVKLRPDYALAHTGLSYSLYLRGKFSEAILQAQAALQIDPKNREAHYIIGMSQLISGSQKDALKRAEDLIRLDPEYAPGYLLKSQALVRFLGDVPMNTKEPPESRNARYSEAAAALEKYLQLAPDAGGKLAWVEQLESLRFYSLTHGAEAGTDRVYSGTETTTKARVLSKPEPEYTEAARTSGTRGIVVLRAIFAADGQVKYILVVRGLPHGLTERAVKAARQIKFTPAAIDGHPVSMFLQLEYSFNLY